MNIKLTHYPKPFIKAILDMIVITGKIDTNTVLQLLVKHGLVGTRTKIIYVDYYNTKQWGTFNCYQHYCTITNSKRQIVFSMKFNDNEIPQILEELKQ